MIELHHTTRARTELAGELPQSEPSPASPNPVPFQAHQLAYRDARTLHHASQVQEPVKNSLVRDVELTATEQRSSAVAAPDDEEPSAV